MKKIEKLENTQTLQAANSQQVVIRDFPNANTIASNSMKTELHTFKLALSSMLKNISFNIKKPIYETAEHCHWYRTKDSSGRDTNGKCASVGGHYHNVTIKEVDGKLVGECSTPIRNSNSEALVEKDTHTHEVHYICSSVVDIRAMSPEAQKMIDSYLSQFRNA